MHWNWQDYSKGRWVLPMYPRSSTCLGTRYQLLLLKCIFCDAFHCEMLEPFLTGWYRRFSYIILSKKVPTSHLPKYCIDKSCRMTIIATFWACTPTVFYRTRARSGGVFYWSAVEILAGLLSSTLILLPYCEQSAAIQWVFSHYLVNCIFWWISSSLSMSALYYCWLNAHPDAQI